MLALSPISTLAMAEAVAGTLGFPSKMPGTSYGIPARACNVGSKLVKVPGSTCSGCYALKGRYIFGGVQQSQNTRLESIDNPQWVEAMVYMLRRAHGLDGHKVHSKVRQAGWHRWHDSGDLQSMAHLARIVLICQLTPEIRHWLPTREAGLIAQFRKNGGTFPANLCVRISATMVDGAPSRAFPNTSTVHKSAAPIGHLCPAPTQGNECGDCRACWSNNVANTSYHVH
jgi:hypothetical protein